MLDFIIGALCGGMIVLVAVFPVWILITIFAGEAIVLILGKIFKRGVAMGILDSIRAWFGVDQPTKIGDSKQSKLEDFIEDEPEEEEYVGAYNGNSDFPTPDEVKRQKRKLATNIAISPIPQCEKCGSPMDEGEFEVFYYNGNQNHPLKNIEAWICSNDECNHWIMDEKQKAKAEEEFNKLYPPIHPKKGKA